MIYLLMSSVALIAGPFVIALASRHPAAREGLDGFILVTLAGIVCLHIAPEAWEVAGYAGLAAGLFGLAFPALLEAVFRSALSRAHLVVLAIAAAGIVVHAVLDGIALLPLMGGVDGEAGSRVLAFGVIIHRLPVGMVIWWVLKPQFGTVVAASTFALVIVTTAAGYFLGGELLVSTAWGLALFQAFVAGSLFHVALFGVSHDHEHERQAGTVSGSNALEAAAKVRSGALQSRAYRTGLLIGLVTIFMLPHISG